MDELYYLYALTRADCPPLDRAKGVDPRYEVEMIRCGRIAGLTSRVGLDDFDLTKMQEGTADLKWLSRIALRHNEIVHQLAEAGPVLPLRLGALFRGKTSLATRLAQCEARVAGFLESLGDRREWAAKIYLDRPRAERALLKDVEPQSHRDTVALGAGEAAGGGVGTSYLTARRERLNRSGQLQSLVRQELLTAEARLGRACPEWRRLRPLSSELTERPESMVWNAAFLVSRADEPRFRAAGDRLRDDLAPNGLLLEVTGPWPVYHFCPALND